MTEEKGLERAIRELKRRNADVLQEAKRRRKQSPKRGEKRRQKRSKSRMNGCYMLVTGEYRTVVGR